MRCVSELEDVVGGDGGRRGRVWMSGVRVVGVVILRRRWVN